MSDRNERIIAVMGTTGTGKSSFIQLLTGDPNIRIGHTLNSETRAIQFSHLWKNGRHVKLVDTPGFDDSHQEMTDADILRELAAFLKEVYDDRKVLTGIIYLHRISDPRVGNVSRANFRMLRDLCGTDSLKNVIITTTFWDDVNKDEGMMRIKELETKTDLFQPVVAAGGKIMIHDKGLESAHSILDAILANEPKPLLIQQEMAQGKSLLDTTVGSGLDAFLTRLIQMHEADMKLLREELDALREQAKAREKELEVYKEQNAARERELRELHVKVERLQGDKQKLVSPWTVKAKSSINLLFKLKVFSPWKARKTSSTI